MTDRVLITGAGRGLGLELARAFTAAGADVVGTVRDLSTSSELAASARPVVMDAQEPDSIAEAVAQAADLLGGLDIVVNNAGVNAMSLPGARGTLALATVTAEPMELLYRINTVAPLLVIQAAADALRASPNARVVNISSWIGSIGATTYSGNYGYAASKAALNMATRLAANELRDDTITVVAVNPGWVQTAMGGPRAELTAPESAAGIVALTQRLTVQDSGRFLQWDGTEHPW